MTEQTDVRKAADVQIEAVEKARQLAYDPAWKLDEETMCFLMEDIRKVLFDILQKKAESEQETTALRKRVEEAEASERSNSKWRVMSVEWLASWNYGVKLLLNEKEALENKVKSLEEKLNEK